MEGIDLQQLLTSPLPNLFLAAVAVKVLISVVKFLTPSIGETNTATPMQLRWAAMALGIAAAFITGIGLFAPAAGAPLPWYLDILNKVLAGFMVGGGAMGVHETQQWLAPKKA